MLTRQDRHQNTKPLIANDHNQRHPACSGRPVGAIHFRCRTAIRVTQGTDKTISDGRFNVYVVYVTRGGKQGNAFFHRRSAEVNCVLSWLTVQYIAIIPKYRSRGNRPPCRQSPKNCMNPRRTRLQKREYPLGVIRAQMDSWLLASRYLEGEEVLQPFIQKK